MGRIRQTIKVDGQECWTLFDTGARNSYVIPSIAQILKTSKLAHTYRTALGGEVKETNTAAILDAEIEGHPITTHALVIEDIGKDEDGKVTEVLFGALAMQNWGIRLIPEEERLDLTHYPEEFVEFCELLPARTRGRVKRRTSMKAKRVSQPTSWISSLTARC